MSAACASAGGAPSEKHTASRTAAWSTRDNWRCGRSPDPSNTQSPAGRSSGCSRSGTQSEVAWSSSAPSRTRRAYRSVPLLLQRRLNGVRYWLGVRLDSRLKSSDHLAVAIDQKFREVPLNLPAGGRVGLFVCQEL